MLGQTIRDMADTKRLGNTAIITVKERMGLLNAPLLMAEFDDLLENGVSQFIVDLSIVRVVDADGDYPLLHLLKCAQSVGGSVTLVCPPGNPVRIFYEMMRLNTLFDIVDTLDAALDPV
jgi:anti-anti-sigma regulatory factor